MSFHLQKSFNSTANFLSSSSQLIRIVYTFWNIWKEKKNFFVSEKKLSRQQQTLKRRITSTQLADRKKISIHRFKEFIYLAGGPPSTIYIFFPFSFLWLLGAKIKDDVAWFFNLFFRRLAAVFLFCFVAPVFLPWLDFDTLTRNGSELCVYIYTSGVLFWVLFFSARREKEHFCAQIRFFQISWVCRPCPAFDVRKKNKNFRPVFPIVVVQFRTQWRTAVIRVRESVALWYYNITYPYIYISVSSCGGDHFTPPGTTFVRSVYTQVCFFFVFFLISPSGLKKKRFFIFVFVFGIRCCWATKTKCL